MSSIWGNSVKISLFGESHGPLIGCVLDGLPSGIKLDLDFIKREVDRRSAKSYKLATPRKEDDEFEIVSGYFNGYTTGTPLAILIKNKNTKSSDYNQYNLRPGHADYTAFLRYNGFQDYRGGGHFSARITASLVAAGAICKQVLKHINKKINIGSRIASIKDIKDLDITDWRDYIDLDLSTKKYPLIDDSKAVEIESEIRKYQLQKDSIGGVVEAWITGLPGGLGDPFFNSIESQLSSILFSIPAVKGIEFGLGFEMTRQTGSFVNDSFIIKDGEIYTDTNNNGGINGGISNGMPIIFRLAFKPTPSIAQKQTTVKFDDLETIDYEIKGRHDPCVVLRAPVIVESVTAIAILNIILGRKDIWNH